MLGSNRRPRPGQPTRSKISCSSISVFSWHICLGAAKHKFYSGVGGLDIWIFTLVVFFFRVILWRNQYLLGAELSGRDATPAR